MRRALKIGVHPNSEAVCGGRDLNFKSGASYVTGRSRGTSAANQNTAEDSVSGRQFDKWRNDNELANLKRILL